MNQKRPYAPRVVLNRAVWAKLRRTRHDALALLEEVRKNAAHSGGHLRDEVRHDGNRIYRNCNDNYFLWRGKCYNCPEGYVCRDNIARPVSWAGCGNYIGSLYQKMVIYALQYCVRPSEANDTIPSEVLGDVNMLMDTVRSDMASVLAEDCARYGGEWVRDFAKANEETCEPAEGIEKNMTFYNETNANLCWGLCKKKATEENGDEP